MLVKHSLFSPPGNISSVSSFLYQLLQQIMQSTMRLWYSVQQRQWEFYQKKKKN